MQYQKRKKTSTKNVIAKIIGFILIFNVGCVAPGAVDLDARLGALETDLGSLTKVAENLSLEWQTLVQAETVNYSGARWVVLGSSVIVIIFLAAFWLLIKMLIEKTNLLKLVTSAVAKAPYSVRRLVKDQVESEVRNGGEFNKKQKFKLESFTKKHGTFAENDG